MTSSVKSYELQGLNLTTAKHNKRVESHTLRQTVCRKKQFNVKLTFQKGTFSRVSVYVLYVRLKGALEALLVLSDFNI